MHQTHDKSDYYHKRYCVLGAGTSGLVVTKRFLDSNILVDCLEKGDDIGGNWNYGKPHSSVYASTQLISSKRLTEYVDFPMPKEYPEYPKHHQVLEYLRSYVEAFELDQHIEFDTAVKNIVPAHGLWRVELASGETRHYQGVVIANGHNWDPKSPDYPGVFDGETLHSSQYKTPDVLKGRRVLVVGAGNSGCDIASEAGLHAAQTFHSTRRGYHYLPRFYRREPIDQRHERMLALGVPLWLRRLLCQLVIRLTLGKPESAGLPRPDHRLFETHPIINSQLHLHLRKGNIKPKPDIEELQGKRVRFTDGSECDVDLIIYATGFNLSFPFIEKQHLAWSNGRPDFFLNIFHPQHDNLFCAGMIQPDSGQWGLVDYQAQLIAQYLRCQLDSPHSSKDFRRQKAKGANDLSDGNHYLDSTRHLLEVEHFSYRELLKRHLNDLTVNTPRTPSDVATTH